MTTQVIIIKCEIHIGCGLKQPKGIFSLSSPFCLTGQNEFAAQGSRILEVFALYARVMRPGEGF